MKVGRGVKSVRSFNFITLPQMDETLTLTDKSVLIEKPHAAKNKNIQFMKLHA